MIETPIFILANPRSGSSVFRLILNSTSNTLFPPECGFIQWLYPKYSNWSLDKIDEFCLDVINSKKMEGWNLSHTNLSLHIRASKPKSYAEVCFYVYEFYGISKGKEVKIWGDKNNYYINHLDIISEIYPNAKYIWLKRNPMDVCASYLKISELSDDILYKPKVSSNIECIFTEIKENYKKIEYFLKKINKYKKISINFEDIVAKNENVLNRINLFVGIDMLEAMDNFDKKIYFDEPEITMAWKGKTKEKIDSNNINSYKLHPNFKEIEKIYSQIFV